MKNKKGFTLVELLVVIAIIGILSTVAIVNLNSARTKAKIANVEGNLAAVIPAVVLCHNEDANIVANDTPGPCTVGTVTVWTEGGDLCTDADTPADWPTLTSDAVPIDCESAYGTGVFMFSASVSGTTITCTQNGCVRS